MSHESNNPGLLLMNVNRRLRDHTTAVGWLTEDPSRTNANQVLITLHNLTDALEQYNRCLDPEGWERAKVELAALEADGTLARLDSAEGVSKT